MSKKPSEQKPVARPNADPNDILTHVEKTKAAAVGPKPRKLSAKERKIAASQHPTPLAKTDAPVVAAALGLLDAISETLKTDGATFPDAADDSLAPATTLIRCAFHDRMEDASMFSKNSAHKNGYASSCKAGLKMRAAEWAKKGAAAR